MKVDPEISIPTRSSEGAAWIEWYKSLESTFGKAQARTTFLKAWNLRGGKNSNANTNELRTFLGTKGIAIDKTLLASVVDTTESTLDSISNIFSTGKTILLVTAVVIGVPIVIMLVNIARDPAKVAGAIKPGL